jgi:hypothetical protein
MKPKFLLFLINEKLFYLHLSESRVGIGLLNLASLILFNAFSSLSTKQSKSDFFHYSFVVNDPRTKWDCRQALKHAHKIFPYNTKYYRNIK